MSISDYSKVFQNNQRLIIPNIRGENFLTIHNLGNLVLTSGSLVACDALAYPNSAPFAEKLKPGCYPVIVSVVHMPERPDLDQLIAYAQLQLEEKRPVRWEYAACEGDDLSLLAEGRVFGYPVDAGVGGFMDEEVALIIFNSDMDEPEEEGWGFQLLQKLQEFENENRYIDRPWTNLCIDPSTQANVIAFYCGWGDGIYVSYLGYDEENRIVSVLTDFTVFNIEEVTWLPQNS